ncbi:hypothetical protein JVU11DRAFT_73 [Chiua virens]|nr:hypothetical protein JVU11DRAFT_73 [Chiua virens]
MGSGRVEGPVHPRASSPALGSPERRHAGLAEDDEEREVDEMISSGYDVTEESDLAARMKKVKKEKKLKLVERNAVYEDFDFGMVRVKERKKRKDEEGSGLKDVTNSPRSRTIEIDNCTPETDVPTSAATSIATSRTFLSTPVTTPMTTPQVSQLPTPRTSSPAPLGATSASESEAPAGGRERRVRKSINYAEPKLNTKMRKPDQGHPAPVTTTAPKKRISSISVQNDDIDVRSSLDVPSRRPVSPLQPPAPKPLTATSDTSSTTGGASVKRKKSRPTIPIDEDEDSDGAQADAEYGNGTPNGWVNTDGRRRSAQTPVAKGSSSLRRVLEADDARRHSLAI